MNLLVLLLAAAPALDLPALPAGDCHEAGFRQVRTLPAMSQPLVMQGDLRIRGADSFEWQINTPYRYGFHVDGERVVETLPDGSERTLDVADAPWLAGMQKVFTALLGGEAEVIENWFGIAHRETLAEGGTRLVLKPESDAIARSVSAIEIEYGEHLQSVRLYDDASIMEIHFEPLRACDRNR